MQRGHLQHMTTVALLGAALPACASLDDPPSLGEVVAAVDSSIWCVHQDRDGDYWFGSNGNGLFHYDGHRIVRYDEDDGLVGGQVRGLLEDAEGNLLITTRSGVTRFDGSSFVEIEIVETSAPDEGWALEPDDVWLVVDADRDGPCRYDGERLYQLELPKSPVEDAFRARHPDVVWQPDGVYCISKDRNGHMWFGTAAVGLCRYDGETFSWMFEERLTTTPAGGAFGIRSIFQDRSGDYWICNTRQRFEISPAARVENGFHLLEYTTKPGLPDAETDTDRNFEYFPSIVEDDDGALWMACEDEIWKFDGEVTRFALAEDSWAICLHRDRDGILWVGTVQHGLYRFDGSGFEPFRLEPAHDE